MTGAVVSAGSTTVTVRVSVVSLPASSLTVYVMVYVPAVVVSTGLSTTIESVISPSFLSVAVAPAST